MSPEFYINFWNNVNYGNPWPTSFPSNSRFWTKNLFTYILVCSHTFDHPYQFFVFNILDMNCTSRLLNDHGKVIKIYSSKEEVSLFFQLYTWKRKILKLLIVLKTLGTVPDWGDSVGLS